jgi:hypothetical protein
MAMPSILHGDPEFSPVLGGPIYLLYRRAHLSGPTLELLRRRVLFFAVLTWLPLFLLSTFSGRLRTSAPLGFLLDIETHVKFLVAVPVLIIAEVVVHKHIPLVVKHFIERRIVISENIPRFYAAIESAMRLRDSKPLELALVLAVFTAGPWLWLHESAFLGSTWYGFSDARGFHLRPAGDWYVFVSIPIFQMLLLRWYFRLANWFVLLWRVSRLNLHLWPAHPDRAGGMGFLGRSSYALIPVLFAQGALVSGFIANNVLYEGQSLLSYKLLVITAVGLFVAVVLGPLVMFTSQLTRTRRSGLAKYGDLASDYEMRFDQKWLGDVARNQEVLGTGDIQSLADLGNSYAEVRKMRLVPFGFEELTYLVCATAAPLVPLLLLIMPLEGVLMKIIKIIA